MISAWILTVVFNIHTSEVGTYRSDSNTATSQVYYYKTRDECIKGQAFYKTSPKVVTTICAPGYK